MDIGYYERYLLSKTNLSSVVSRGHNDTGNIFLDNYVLEYLDLPEKMSEKDLQKSILNNIKSFILEIGKDYTFIGEEYRVQVGNHDYYIDLLFYHREFVVVKDSQVQPRVVFKEESRFPRFFSY